MSVTARFSVGIAAYKKSKFAMRFQSDNAVINLHAGFLQTARPADVGSFVETCFQFYDDGDFFTRGGADECANDGRILAGAIKSLLDAENVGIVRGAFDKLHDGQIGIVWVVEKDVTLAQYVKHRGSFAAHG